MKVAIYNDKYVCLAPNLQQVATLSWYVLLPS